MKIKHWQGYGTVNAKKVASNRVYDPYYGILTNLVIEVTGEHEWGIYTEDKYTINEWLVKKFIKSDISEKNIVAIEVNYVNHNDDDVMYSIYIKED